MLNNAQTTEQSHSSYMLATNAQNSPNEIGTWIIQQYVNQKLPDVQAGFRKGRGTKEKIAKVCWIIEKAREFQKKIYFCFIDYTKAFDCVDHNKL